MKSEIAKRETPEEKKLRKKLAELAELEGRLGENELEKSIWGMSMKKIFRQNG